MSDSILNESEIIFVAKLTTQIGISISVGSFVWPGFNKGGALG